MYRLLISQPRGNGLQPLQQECPLPASVFPPSVGSEIPVGSRHRTKFEPGSRFFHEYTGAVRVIVTRDQKNFMNTAPLQFTGDVLGFIECRDCIAPERLEVGWRKAVRLRERNGFIGLIGKQV